MDSAFIVVLGKRVGLIQAAPTWMKMGVPASIAFNSASQQTSTSALWTFLWGIEVEILNEHLMLPGSLLGALLKI